MARRKGVGRKGEALSNNVPGPPIRSEKEKYWRKEIEMQKNGGMSAVQYCNTNGLSLTSFQWWVKEIRKRDRVEAVEALCIGTDDAEKDESNPFIALKIETTGVADSGLEIVLRGGATIKVTDGTPMNLLARVLKMLEETKC